MNSATIDKQIDTYLARLTAIQKKTILSVVKTIADARQEYANIWENKTFEKEMDRRTAEYENGTAKLYKFEEMKKTAVASYRKKKHNRK